MAAVVVLLVTRIVTLEEAYEAIDWPVIILLGAMIPVGEALETTGGAARIAATLCRLGRLPASLGNVGGYPGDDNAAVRP